MLIPRSILKLQVIASKDKTRYAMNGIAFDRDPSTKEAIACATDGHRLLECRWDDNVARNDFPTCGVDLSERKDRHMSVIPLDAIKASEKSIPKKGATCRQYLALEEPTANGTVRLATVDDNGPTVREVKSIDGYFPPYLEVMPPAKGHATIKIGINARYLLELAEALHAAHESGEKEPTVILEIKDAVSPINVRAMGSSLSGVSTRAVLMPINHDTRCEGGCGRAPEVTGEPLCKDCKNKASAPKVAEERQATSEPTKRKRKANDKASAPAPACPTELAPVEPATPAAVLGASDLEW